MKFPSNHYGEFVGYKTDHDPRQRATSVGPFTSKSMVEALESRIQTYGIPVIGHCRLVDLVVADGKVVGALLLRTDVDEQGEGQTPTEEIEAARAKSEEPLTGDRPQDGEDPDSPRA